MITVGLTGGIGSGKSTVAELLSSYGAVVIDADVLAREAVEPGTAGLASVVKEFGAEMLAADGSLDRTRLGAVVFADPDRLAALNKIIHPYVGARRAELTAAAPSDAVVVFDVPLLVEKGLEDAYDLVVVVDVSPATQLARLVESRGMSEDEAVARIASQATRERRRAAADVILDNEGDLAALDRQVTKLWRRLLSTDQVYWGVCWRLEDDEVQVLLVLAQDRRWRFPNGHRDPADDLPSDTVRREVAEEAGIRGEVGERPFTKFTYDGRDGRHERVTAFLVHSARLGEPRESVRWPIWWCSREEAEPLLSAGRSAQEIDGYMRVLEAALRAVASWRGSLHN